MIEGNRTRAAAEGDVDDGAVTAGHTVRLQFGLGRLIALVTIVAAVLAIFRWSEWPLSSAFVCMALLTAGVLLPPRARNSFAAIMICMYAPYGWLIWDHYPWTEYRWGWIGMWPVLPGIVPAAAFFHSRETLEFAVMAVVTLLFAAVAGYVATRGRVWFLLMAAIVVSLSVLNSLAAYAAFRA